MPITKEEFLKDVNDWSNHRFLLWLALEETQTGPVLELGCGDGSTPFLHEYCKANKRKLYSFDTEQTWIDQFSQYATKDHTFTRIINNWHIAKDICPNPSVILIDHAPGERRIVDISRFEDEAGIMVCHDTQPKPTGADYGYERIWHLFRYRVDLKVDMNPELYRGQKHHRTWASAISKRYDVTKWKGTPTDRPDYRIE